MVSGYGAPGIDRHSAYSAGEDLSIGLPRPSASQSFSVSAGQAFVKVPPRVVSCGRGSPTWCALATGGKALTVDGADPPCHPLSPAWSRRSSTDFASSDSAPPWRASATADTPTLRRRMELNRVGLLSRA
ncbi:hypothetical protein HYH03_014764 [Edaphochlamys debaryana]|uniref:Uncharacterized protein n=1 Tax=Edaphochlamys debaryana TaxID=47281 RepID=A0A836BRW2_9CHLO|nr:hypothetical protein HYH03_014764 [Edaphochlamys debaryana]|eukprot:KAG2486595.1 hypothetical protein HYH03_014764 [Edaphochlamys debaryana]